MNQKGINEANARTEKQKAIHESNASAIADKTRITPHIAASDFVIAQERKETNFLSPSYVRGVLFKRKYPHAENKRTIPTGIQRDKKERSPIRKKPEKT
jgi:hypothetical protein